VLGPAIGLTVGVTGFDGAAYQARFDSLAALGVDVHGEATLVRSLAPASVMDAGCGTGRVAIELARHGIAVVGVDVDRSMIAEARRRNPDIEWIEADMSSLDLGRTFDVVVMAGNVPLFCPAGRRSGLVRSCARHLAPAGRLLAGFQLDRGFALDDYDQLCADAGLVLDARWSTWDGRDFDPGGDYAVSVHRGPEDRAGE
jgi:SAM-dependent methyltransferase